MRSTSVDSPLRGVRRVKTCRTSEARGDCRLPGGRTAGGFLGFNSSVTSKRDGRGERGLDRSEASAINFSRASLSSAAVVEFESGAHARWVPA